MNSRLWNLPLHDFLPPWPSSTNSSLRSLQPPRPRPLWPLSPWTPVSKVSHLHDHLLHEMQSVSTRRRQWPPYSASEVSFIICFQLLDPCPPKTSASEGHLLHEFPHRWSPRFMISLLHHLPSLSPPSLPGPLKVRPRNFQAYILLREDSCCIARWYHVC